MSAPRIHSRTGDRIDAPTLEGLLHLRQGVFIVEQACAYADIDGHDLEPTTRHLWIEADGIPVATLRIRPDRGGTALWVGRVCTAAPARGHGHAGRLLREAVDTTTGPLRLNAQERLEGWYTSFGFIPSGAAFDEDGIRHVPMRLHR
jgi:ElaA protein